MFMGNLAEIVDISGRPIEPPPTPLFPWWVALRVEPLRERKSADWLERLAGVTVFLPLFPRKVRCFGNRHRQVMYPVVPGLLFVPTDVWQVDRREDLFDIARVHGYLHHQDGQPHMISKADIDVIREIEGKLNLPPPPGLKGTDFKPGDAVTFVNELWAAMFGDGVVTDVANAARIGVEVQKMFGERRTIFCPASEIERK
jgi:hypothetical protein